MRFLVDTDVPDRVGPDLRAAGHDAVHVHEIGLGGGDRHALVTRASDDHRVIITDNKDLEWALRAGDGSSPSLILIRDDSSPPEDLSTLVLGALTPMLRDVLGAGAIISVSRDETTFRSLRY